MALQFSTTDGDVSHVRLDADFYHVDDIHGVTEGLAGSGNLNYLVLQSRQTDEMRQSFDPFAIQNGNMWFPENGIGGLAGGAHGILQPPQNTAAVSNAGDELRALHGGGSSIANTDHFDSNGFSSLKSLISATDHDTNTLNFHGERDFSSILDRIHDGGRDGLNGTDGNGTDGNGHDGRDGRDGIDGHSPEPPPPPPPTPDPDPVPDSDTDLNLHAHDGLVSTDLGVLLDPVEKLVGDIDINVNQGLDLSPVLSGHLPDLGLSADPLLLGTHLPLVDTTPILDPIASAGNGLLDSLSPVTQPILDSVLSALPPEVTEIIGGMNQDGDTDLVLNTNGTLILGLPLIQDVTSIPLDPVEHVFGDIDLNLNPQLDVLSNGSLADIGLGGTYNGEALPNINLASLSTPVTDVLGYANPLIDQIQTPDALNGPAPAVDGVQNLANGLGTQVDGLLDPVLNPVDSALTPVEALGSNAPNVFEGVIDDLDHSTGLENSLSGTLDPAGSLLSQVQDGLGNVADQAADPIHGLTDLTGSLAGNLADITTPVEGQLADTLNGLGGGDPTQALGDLGSTAQTVLSDAGDTVQDILGNAGDPGDLGGTLQNALSDVFNPPASGGDTDLSANTHNLDVAGITVPDLGLNVNLDPVEAITGDIDVNAGAGGDVLSHGVVADPVASVSAVIDPAEGLLNALTNNLLGNITNDVASVTGLSATASGLPDTGGGIVASAGADLPISGSWPETGSAVSDAVHSVGNIMSGSGQGTPALPDPIGHLAEGLGGVVDHSHSTTHIHGLLG